ncbi:MAG: HNH endonuclease [Verrucomicrobiae bacterium]|nr:HNH endonuclease [Verrucomicrobiae bacterium]MCP5544808.1 HNH endonuclease [Akkermansiaceae bacterium]
MAAGIRWTRDELLIVLNLYHKLRFGQFDQRQPVIIDLAARLGRTPSSIAMKLSNLASLDPALKLRGIEGLKGASTLDRAVWDEFHDNPAKLVPLSQERFEALFTENESETTEVIPGKGIRTAKRPPAGETEVKSVTKQRRGQDYFRDVVLNNFGGCCGVTGLSLRELLIASHILPWRDHEPERLNVRNGICLNRLHDAAFDQHLIGFDDELRLVLSIRLKSLLPGDWICEQFEAFEGKALRLPEDGTRPDPSFLAAHRKKLAHK